MTNVIALFVWREEIATRFYLINLVKHLYRTKKRFKIIKNH